MCVSIFSTTSVANISSHSKKNLARYDKRLNWSSCKILSDFNGTWIFWTQFSKNTQISNFMKIRSVGAVLFHAAGQTDLTKPIVTFSNFANAPKKRGHLWKSPHRKTDSISNNISVAQTTRFQITEDNHSGQSFIVGFTVNRVALEQFILPRTSVLSCTIPLMLPTHSSFIYNRWSVTLATGSFVEHSAHSHIHSRRCVNLQTHFSLSKHSYSLHKSSYWQYFLMHLRKLDEEVDHNKTANGNTRITFTLWRLRVILSLPRLS